MARERITDGFYDEQQSLFALRVLNFSMWFVALMNGKKKKKTNVFVKLYNNQRTFHRMERPCKYSSS